MNATSSKERKKQKVADARTIHVQQPVASGSGSNKVAVSFVDSMKGLPGAVDVEKFAEARAFEISSMQSAMESASSSSTKRAWQLLPRHMRRRAASHDVRRVPVQLREKAKAEMDPVKKNAVLRKIRSSKKAKKARIARTEQFAKRQQSKAWLETHIWHAKRMHMKEMWGHRLAITPTAKAYRPSHRASLHDAIVHDASYLATIELSGEQRVLKAILDSCTDPQEHSCGAKMYLGGSRVFHTHIYVPGAYPYNLIGPAAIFWRPQPDTETEKGKERETQTYLQRTIWVQVHPSIYDECYAIIRNSTSAALQQEASLVGEKEKMVEIADLRGQVNIFEVMGPKSSQVLKGALVLASTESEETREFWNNLGNIQTTGSLPAGIIAGLCVNDPRLKFPPHNAPVHPEQTVPIVPTAKLAKCSIWDQPHRKTPRFKKAELDERRHKNAIPGTPLQILRQDDRVPVLLIQRSVGSGDNSIHGWTLIVPNRWAMAFFSSLTYTGSRVGGQREKQVQSLEAGIDHFPKDYPGVLAYDQYVQGNGEEERERWQRKPPAKRVNYTKLGVRSPFRADWEVVLGLKHSSSLMDMDMDNNDNETLPTQREDDTFDRMLVDDIERAREVDEDGPDFPYWLLRGLAAPKIFKAMTRLFSSDWPLMNEINSARAKRGMDHLADSDDKRAELLSRCLVSVSLELCGGRGCPDELGVIYALEDNLVREWLAAEHRGKVARDDDTYRRHPCPHPDQIIGYITTGNFSLSRGEGFGIAAMPLRRLIQLHEQSERLQSINQRMMVGVRNREDTLCWPAYVRLISD